MKRYWTEERLSWKDSPMAYWVHIEADGKPWYEAEVFEPPAPVCTENGYRVYFVEVDDFTFEFTSLAQLRHCIDILSRKVLPTTRRLSELRGGFGGAGPNTHWLSRLPASTKPWRYREKAVRYLRKALDAMEKEEVG